MAAILITTIVTKRFIKFSKFNEEMLEVGGEFFRSLLFYCMSNILF